MEMSVLAPQKVKTYFKKDYFEQQSWEKGQTVVGLDEVGRGCLAGPLVTAAVMLPCNKTHRQLKDSKLLTGQKREKAFAWIVKHCRYALGIVDHRVIDSVNIWHATLVAMRKATLHLLAVCPRPSVILTDAMPLSLSGTAHTDIPVHYFINGERKSSSIAAASIVAKVVRDNLMKQFDPLFPYYQLRMHKGYATKIHQDALITHGQSLIHRSSFMFDGMHVVSDNREFGYEQQSLC